MNLKPWQARLGAMVVAGTIFGVLVASVIDTEPWAPDFYGAINGLERFTTIAPGLARDLDMAMDIELQPVDLEGDFVERTQEIVEDMSEEFGPFIMTANVYVREVDALNASRNIVMEGASQRDNPARAWSSIVAPIPAAVDELVAAKRDVIDYSRPVQGNLDRMQELVDAAATQDGYEMEDLSEFLNLTRGLQEMPGIINSFLAGLPEVITGVAATIAPTIPLLREGAEDFATLADAIFTDHVLALEALGILLTAAMIGAMVIARPLGTMHDSRHYATRRDRDDMDEVQDISDVDRNLAGTTFVATPIAPAVSPFVAPRPGPAADSEEEE